MRRFSKTFSGIAAIMLGVGIILAAVGLSRAKADWEKLREETPGRDRVEKEFAGIESIDLAIPFGYLKVGTAADNKVHFEAVNVNENLRIREEDGELDIHMDGNKNILQYFSISLMGLHFDRDEFIIQEYQLLLPEDYQGKVEIHFDGGKLMMDEVRAGEVDISMDVGELDISGCDIKRLKASCDVGEIKVDGRFRDISVKNGIGALGVNVYGEKEDYKGSVRCGIGNLGYYDYSKADVSHVWHWEGGLGVREKWDGRNAAGKLEVESDIGEVSVMFSGHFEDAVADVPRQPQDIVDYGTNNTADVIPEETGTDAWEIPQDGPAMEQTGTK